MSSLRRIAALLCAILCLTGCKDIPVNAIAPAHSSASSQAPAQSGVLTLAYSEQDSLNPYLSQNNITLQLSDLLYEKMVQLAPDMSLQMRAVREVTMSGPDITIYPDTGYTYMDGSSVSAEDIAACLNAARADVLYKAQFANISAITVADDAVHVTLLAPDSLFTYLLCLPIIKAEDISSLAPTASGRYYFDSAQLVRNDSCKNASPMLPDRIALRNVSGFDEIVSLLDIGELSLYSTELENNFSSTTGLQTFYKLNNLVFVGINALRGEGSLLSQPDGRRAISSLLDKQLLADKCYYSRAYPAFGAINSLYPCISSQQQAIIDANTADADALLTGLGYSKDAFSGYYKKGTARLELDMLVYSKSTYKRNTANLIKESLRQNGIYINLIQTDNFDIYTQKIAAKEFDMYIGEIKMYNNMDLVPFLPDGAASSGIAMSEGLMAAYAQFKGNSANAFTFEQAFAREMPYIPLLWRCGTLVTGKNIHGIVPGISDTFYNMDALECTDATAKSPLNIK